MYAGFIYYSPKLKQLNGVMDIQIIIQPHNEILLSNTKEWTIGLCVNMDITQKTLY